MSYDYKDKVAVITGASSGIGEAAALDLARRGVRVLAAARRKDRLEALAQKIRALGGVCEPMVCDVTREEDNQRMAARALELWGRLDILLLNAGRGNMASIEETDAAMVRSIFEINVFALYHGVRAALPAMRKQGQGRIITIASVAGKMGAPYMNAYVAAKHAAVGFSNVLRLELIGTGIECTVICPAGVMTEWASVTEGGPILNLFAESIPRAKEIAKEMGIKGKGGGGMLTAEEISAAILSAIENPVPEIYTHPGTHEAFIEAATDRAAAERIATPLALAMRETYPRLRKS